MAVLSRLQGLSIEVVVDDEALIEYDPPAEETIYFKENMVVKYIEVPSDSLYVIRYSVDHPQIKNTPSLSLDIHIDSQYVTGEFLEKKRYLRRRSRVIRGKPLKLPDGNVFLKKFRFRTMNKEDAQSKAQIEKDIENLKGVGEIRVELHRQGHGTPVRMRTENSVLGAPSSVASKATIKNGISHGTFFESEDAQERTSVEAPYLDGRNNPLAVFIFKYRSRASLQNLGIIPRSPSPDLIEGLDEEKIRELARRQIRAELNAPRARSYDAEEGRGKRKRRAEDDTETTIDLTGGKAVVETTAKKRKTSNRDQVVDLH